MLEASQRTFAEVSAQERGRAEAFAASYLATQMEQDLIPAADARRMVAEHRAGNTTEWARAVHAALVGLRTIEP